MLIRNSANCCRPSSASARCPKKSSGASPDRQPTSPDGSASTLSGQLYGRRQVTPCTCAPLHPASALAMFQPSFAIAW
eukprot:3030288-Rhodomonas_salina.5